MKNTDIQEIRQLLKQAETNMLQGGNHPIVYKNAYAAGIEQALSLLPCETCKDTGVVSKLGLADIRGQGYMVYHPCPDCQSCKICNGTG